MKPRWECLEPGVYRYFGKNSKGVWMIWVERGCDTHSGKYPNWYWTIIDNEYNEVKVGNELSFIEAKGESLNTLHRLLNQTNDQFSLDFVAGRASAKMINPNNNQEVK